MAPGGWSTVSDQMRVLVSIADQLVKESTPGDSVITQVTELSKIGRGGLSTLEDAEKKEINASRQLEEWLEKVHAAILKADGVLDECKYHVRSGGAGHPKENPRNKYLPSMSSSTSKRLKRENSALQNALENLKKVSEAVPGGDWKRSAAGQARKDSSEIESKVAGEIHDVKTIVDKLLSSCNETGLSILALVGWVESGTTALARLLYKHPEIMSYFDERIWVRAPRDHNFGAIEKCMLASLSVDKPASSLHERLKGKRFLLVLVDVDGSDLNQTKFSLLKDFLDELGGSRGSKLLITTGSNPKKIGVFYEYEIELSTDDYCRKMLERSAFADGGPTQTHKMVKIGASMIQLCEGKPLYVKLLGSLLNRMKEERQWESIRSKLSWPGGITIPKLCFDHINSLPLKRCFQYCFFFPKGYLMHREELIELWMAQGYLNVPRNSGLTMEALGQQYYDILMRSSFLQVSEDNDFDAQSCKVPDALHGLDLFTEPFNKCFQTIVKGHAKDVSGDCLHLTLIACDEKHSRSFKGRSLKLQSLRLENTKGLTHLLACAQGLRVLIVVDASLEELPNWIGKLIRLRYLDISRTSIVRLPDSISELYNLQTLKLHDLQELPKNFEKLLVRMMHLYIQKLEDLYEMYDLLSKCGELVYLSSAKATLKVFMDKEGRHDPAKLHKLAKRCSTISIHCLEYASEATQGIGAWLSEIPRTESLKLNWSARRETRIDEDVAEKLVPNQSLKHLTLENFKGTKFPSWMTKVDPVLLSNLVQMELENCSWCEQLPPLGHLSCLRILKIVGMDNVKSIAQDFYGIGGDSPKPLRAFPKLKEFTMCGMSNLEDWSGSAASSTAAFPYLERFEVDQCPKLKGIPDIVLSREQKYLLKFKVSHCENLTHLPKGLGEVECVEDLELFGLPALDKFSLGCGNTLKSLIIGCFSAKLKEDDLLNQPENLSSLKNLTIWGYGQDSIPDCFGKLTSLQLLKFESCRKLKNLPRIMSLKELHICYCPLLEDSCIRGSRPEWPKVSHIETIVVNNEKIREPPTVKGRPVRPSG